MRVCCLSLRQPADSIRTDRLRPKRATRLIEFDIRHPYEPRTQLLEFGELVGKPSSKRAYTYAVNQTTPGEGEGDDLLRKPSLWSQLSGLFR